MYYVLGSPAKPFSKKNNVNFVNFFVQSYQIYQVHKISTQLIIYLSFSSKPYLLPFLSPPKFCHGRKWLPLGIPDSFSVC